MSRKEFMQVLREQPDRGVIAHKLVFSLSQDEQQRLGVDMKDLVRETMADYQARLGRQLRRIAFERRDPGHPHVHVVLAGRDAAGKQVGIYPKDLTMLRGLSDRQRDRLADWSRITDLGRHGPSRAKDEPRRAVERAGEHPSPLLSLARATIEGLIKAARENEHERERGRGRGVIITQAGRSPSQQRPSRLDLPELTSARPRV